MPLKTFNVESQILICLIKDPSIENRKKACLSKTCIEMLAHQKIQSHLALGIELESVTVQPANESARSV